MEKSFEVIKTFDEFKERGWLKYKNLPAYCLGDILDNTGKVLMALGMYKKYSERVPYALTSIQKEIINNEILYIISNLYQKYTDYGLIPRTDSISEPNETLKGRWETVQAMYIRTDVSHSQLFSLCSGLYFVKGYGLLNSLLFDLAYLNGWKIKNKANKTTQHGNFRPPIGNVGLRMQALYMLLKKMKTFNSPQTTLKFSDKFLWKLSLQTLSNFHCWQDADSSDVTAMAFILLRELDPNMVKYSYEWFKKLQPKCKNIFFSLVSGGNFVKFPAMEAIIDGFPLTLDRGYVWKRDYADSIIQSGAITTDAIFLRTDLLLFEALYYYYRG